MKTAKKEKTLNSSSPTIIPLNVVDEQMTRDMADIFEKREDPNWKETQRIKRNREELMDKSELGL